VFNRAMMAYWVSGGTAPDSLILGTRNTFITSFLQLFDYISSLVTPSIFLETSFSK